MDFYEKENYTIEDIQGLIFNEVEENIHLDFKDAQSIDKSDGKKKELSKDVSAFANSDGGIIIYGLKEINHKASIVSYVDGNIYTKEWLEQVINSTIQRKIKDLKIIPIRNNGNIEETVYIVKIPKSFDKPHIAKDKRFYKRYNFESVMMEEYEIRDSYFQRQNSDLCIASFKVVNLTQDNGELKMYFSIDISNSGNTIEEIYKINVDFFDYRSIKIEPEDKGSTAYTTITNGHSRLSTKGALPIYPGEEMSTFRFALVVDINEVYDYFQKFKMKISLLFSNGEDELNIDSEFFSQIIQEKLS